MIEYKFRGKREDANVWVFGYVFKTAKANPWSDETTWIFNEERKFKVEPETVGQYITKDDKNGVEIYEDDIVKFNSYTNISDQIGVIKWYKYGYTIKNGKGQTMEPTSIISMLFFDSENLLEVIGNTHENPKLLESQT